MLNPVKSTEYSRETSLVYTQEYPITLSMFGIGQMPRLNARCLPIVNVESNKNTFVIKFSHILVMLHFLHAHILTIKRILQRTDTLKNHIHTCKTM